MWLGRELQDELHDDWRRIDLSIVMSDSICSEGSNEAVGTTHDCWWTAVFNVYLGMGQRLPRWCLAPAIGQGCSETFYSGYFGVRICCCCAATANSGNGQIQVWISLVAWKSCCTDRKRGQEGASRWCSGREEVRMFAPKKKNPSVYHIVRDCIISWY